jgi:hypothetical protein
MNDEFKARRNPTINILKTRNIGHRITQPPGKLTPKVICEANPTYMN